MPGLISADWKLWQCRHPGSMTSLGTSKSQNASIAALQAQVSDLQSMVHKV